MSGTVTDEASGDPVDGAVVVVRDTTSGRLVSARTEADGAYEFAGISPGTHEIFATDVLLSSAVGELVVPVSGPAQTVDLAIATGGSIAGTIVAPGGAPVGNAVVSARTPTGDLTTTSSADGTFTVPAVSPGTTTLVVTAPTWAGRALDVDVVADVATDAGSIELVPSATVTGVVEDAAGDPIVGAIVGADSEARPTTVTGADGSFTLANVPAGTATLFATAEGYLPSDETAVLAVGSTGTVDFALAVGFAIDVTVVSEAPAPVADAVVRVGPIDPDGANPVSRSTDAAGLAVFGSLAPGTYVVTVGASSEEVVVDSADVAIEMTAPSGHEVTGRVVDALGAAVPDAYVVVFDASAGPATEDGRLTEIATLADGTFAFTAAAGTALELVVSDPEVGLRRVSVAPAGNGATTDLGDIGPVGAPAVVTAAWTGLDDEAVATLVPLGLDDDLGVLVGNTGTAIADTDQFDFGSVPDGDYRLQYTGSTSQFNAVVTVAGATPLTVARPATAPLAGVALDDDGAPLPDAVILAWTTTGGQSAETIANAAGAWTLGAVQVGTWFVAVTHPELGVLSIDEVTVAVGPAGFRSRAARSITMGLRSQRSMTSERPSYLGPDDRGCTSTPDTRLPVIGRVTSDLVAGGWDGKATTVYYRAVGQAGFMGSVPATDPSGWFRTPELPDGNYEVIVRAEGHVATAPVQFAIPQDVVGDIRCGANLLEIQRGVSVIDPPPPPPLPSFGDVAEIFKRSFDDNRPSRASLEQIREFQPPTRPEQCPTSAPGTSAPPCPPPPSATPPPPPRATPPCPAPPAPPLDPPSGDETDDDSDDDNPTAEAYLAQAKAYANQAWDLHDRWGVQIITIRKEFGILLALAAFRFAIVADEVVGLYVAGAKFLRTSPGSFEPPKQPTNSKNSAKPPVWPHRSTPCSKHSLR